MTRFLLIVSFVYMLLIAAFLAFAAIWICDGYYPVGWGWKGASLHFAFWIMPLSVVAGSFMSAVGIRRRFARILLLAGIGPTIAVVIYDIARSTFSPNHQPQTIGFYLPLIVAATALIAFWYLSIRRDSRLRFES